MAAPGGSGGAGRRPGNSPERERGRRRRRPSHGSETETFGDGAVAGGAGILRAHQRLGGQRLLSEYPMNLDRDTTNLLLLGHPLPPPPFLSSTEYSVLQVCHISCCKVRSIVNFTLIELNCISWDEQVPHTHTQFVLQPAQVQIPNLVAFCCNVIPTFSASPFPVSSIKGKMPQNTLEKHKKLPTDA